MRIQLVAVGSTGDVQPMLVLGRELASRGHTVCLAAFRTFEDTIRAAGLEYSPLPGDAERYIGSIIRPGANPLTYLSRFVASLKDTLTALLDAMYDACEGADAIVASFFGTAIYDIAEARKIPLFQTNYCLIDCTGDHCLPVMRQLPLGRGFNRMTYRLAYRMIAWVESRYVTPWCQSKGIRARSIANGPDYRLNGATVPVLCAFSEHVVPRPPEWADNVHIVGFWEEHTMAFSPSDTLQTFLAGGPTPVYIGFGSMNTGNMERALDAVLYALERNNLRAVLSSGWGRLGRDTLPDTVHVLHEYVSHHWLFSRVCAVVHHGGAGTTAAGLAAGRPTLVVPFGSDQFFWGDRIHALQCGPKPLLRTRLTGKRLARSLHALTQTPAYHENARLLQAKLSTENGQKASADLLESVMKEYQK